MDVKSLDDLMTMMKPVRPTVKKLETALLKINRMAHLLQVFRDHVEDKDKTFANALLQQMTNDCKEMLELIGEGELLFNSPEAEAAEIATQQALSVEGGEES